MKSFILLISSFLFTHLAFSQNIPAKVEAIKFATLQDDWVQMEIQIRARKNTNPNVKNDRFVDNIKVMSYLAYKRNDKLEKFDFYKAEAEIISIEQGKKQSVYFFVPGVIVKRDRLPKTPPYYFVVLEVDGKILPFDNNAFSQATLNSNTIRSMKLKADVEGESNNYILKPHYNAPVREIGARLENLAPLIIREPKE